VKFWFDFEVPSAKIVVGRVILFGLLAIDALTELVHAPRYGAGFNVAQLPGLDALGPGRIGYGTCELILAYVFVLIAFGVATRWLVPLAAVIYNWLYFGSQLDSYQHHYLIAMLLVIACFVPWQPARGPVRTWALRLMLVELAIVYLWAAISKIDPLWLDGTALAGQLHGSLRSLIDATIGMRAVAILVPLTELALTLVWWRPAWKFLAPLGIAFHLGIVWSGLEIGLFAWLMIGLYAFVLPDRLYAGMRVPARPAPGPRTPWIVLGSAVCLGLVAAARCRFPGTLTLAIIASLVVIAASVVTRKHVITIAIAHLVALTTWLAVDRTSSIAREYYNFWGGTSRRLKNPSDAEAAYRRLAEIAPDDAPAHYYLGLALLDRDDEAGIDELHTAQRLDNRHARAYNAEARWLALHGKSQEALAKARDATLADPNDAEARKILTALTSGRPPPAAHDN
jgi:tetratricopeptide (TPR) repeat protein